MVSPRTSARQTLRRFALSVALLLGSFMALAGMSGATASTLIPFEDAGGPGGGGGAAAVPASLAVTANERSIALIESKEPTVATVVHMSPNARTIALIEGADPANAGFEFVTSPSATEGPAIAVDEQDVNFCRACDTLL